jgi:hypothetical protein
MNNCFRDRHASDPASLFLTGRDNYMLTDFKKATEYLRKAVIAAPQDSEFVDWLGRAYVERRDKTGMLLGMKEPHKKGESESILAPSLAASIARCRSKRRQGYRWAGRWSFEKRVNQDADLLTYWGRQHGWLR